MERAVTNLTWSKYATIGCQPSAKMVAGYIDRTLATNPQWSKMHVHPWCSSLVPGEGGWQVVLGTAPVTPGDTVPHSCLVSLRSGCIIWTKTWCERHR